MYATNRSAVKALLLYDIKGGSRVHMYKYVCVCAVEGGGGRFAEFISFS